MRRTAQRLMVSLVAAVVVVPLGGSALAADADGYARPGRTELITAASDGRPASYPPVAFYGGPGSGQMDITPDGRYVAFVSDATNLVAGDTNGGWDAFRHDRRTGRTIRVSVASNGDQAMGLLLKVDSVAISADGRYVAFSSNAANLVPGTTPSSAGVFRNDVYRHDTRAGRTVRVSVGPTGDQPDSLNESQGVALSADGRFVAFASYATNLVAGDTNNAPDVFVRDMRVGKTRRASVSSRGTQANAVSRHPAISANGRYVSFASSASNLVPHDNTDELCDCDAPNIFRRDMRTGKTVRVSVASDGSQASFAAFPSCTVGASSPITLPDAVRDVVGEGKIRFSICGSFRYGNSTRMISADGRYITYFSNATNLVPNDTNFDPVTNGHDAFIYDMKTGRTERISVDSYGRQLDGVASMRSSVSADGRYVTFQALAPSGCGNEIDPAADVVGDAWRGLLRCAVGTYAESFVHDRMTGATDPVARSVTGGSVKHGECQGLGDIALGTWAGAVSSGGRHVAMFSSDTNLVTGDSNDKCDFFVRDRGAALGVGGFGGAYGGTSSPPRECVGSDLCLPPLTAAAAVGNAHAPGADLIGARVVQRPGLGDLFVRLDLARMPAVSGAPAGGLLYGLRFTAGGERYEVRVQRVAGADFDPKGGASFGLFRQDATTGLFTKVAVLKGGYGTVGETVVTAVPLSLLDGRAQMSDVTAYTAVGNYLAGPTKVLDSLRVTR